MCSQLGKQCRWIGVSTDPSKDSDAAIALNDLASFGVDYSLVDTQLAGSFPVSVSWCLDLNYETVLTQMKMWQFILTSRRTGSRTIVHHRNMPELSLETFNRALTRYAQTRLADASPVWFHFEGRNMEVVLQMLLLVRSTFRNALISVEVEALRYDWKIAKR